MYQYFARRLLLTIPVVPGVSKIIFPSSASSPVNLETSERFPRTLIIETVSLVIATLVGVSAGIVPATHRNSLFDNASMLVALVGAAALVFWMALIL